MQSLYQNLNAALQNTFFSVLFCLIALSYPALAEDLTYNITAPSDTAHIIDYGLEGDTATINYNIKNKTIHDDIGHAISISGNGTLVLSCDGDSNLGGWKVTQASGKCWGNNNNITYDRPNVINGINGINGIEHMRLASPDI